MSIVQIQSLKQSQRLNPQQIHLINILSLPTVALEQFIANEMTINPALEFETDVQNEEHDDDYEFNENDDHNNDPENDLIKNDYDQTDFMDKNSLDNFKSEYVNNAPEESKLEKTFVEMPHFTASLIEQLHLSPISCEEKILGEYLIHSLDDDGYMRRSLDDLSDELSFVHNKYIETEHLESILFKIQRLEPFGIGSRNLKECLSVQLEMIKHKTKEIYIALDIVDNHLELLAEKKYDIIKAALNIEQEDFEDTLEEIQKLNPVPAGCCSEDSGKAISIQPDFTVVIYGDKLELFLNSTKQFPLKVSEAFSEMYSEYKNSKNVELKNTSHFLKNKIESANALIEALALREKMMTKIANAIVNYQYKYFITGDHADLKPMILKNIAEETASDISTVSRIANSKYIQTNHGVILMKQLFVQGIANDSGEIISTSKIKTAIIECIEKENKNKPLSDDEISHLLTKRNYTIARRTVAKYREELNISNKNNRKMA